jgi:O-antigen/teichoic acid export membrane protein
LRVLVWWPTFRRAIDANLSHSAACDGRSNADGSSRPSPIEGFEQDRRARTGSIASFRGVNSATRSDDQTALDRLMGKTVGVALIRVVGLALGFCISVHVARSVGDSEFGRYEGWLAWIGMASVMLGLGTDRMIARFVATYSATNDRARLHGLLRPVAIVTAILGAAALAVLIVSIATDRPPSPWLVGMSAIVATVAFRSMQAVLNGFGAVTWSQSLDLLVLPLAFWSAFLIWLEMSPASAAIALGSQAAGILIALSVAGIIARSRWPSDVGATIAAAEWPEWWAYSRSLFALAVLQIGLQRTDLAAFDLVGDAAALGHYAAAKRIAGPVVAIVLAVNAAASPLVARLHARGESAQLQSMLSRMARMTTAVAVVLSIPLLVLGDWILGWFGAGFRDATTALRILVVAQVFNAACGSVLLALIMTGHARAALPGLAIANLLQAGAAALFAPRWGATGAAIAASAGTVAWNLLLSLAVRRHLRLDASVIGRAPHSG